MTWISRISVDKVLREGKRDHSFCFAVADRVVLTKLLRTETTAAVFHVFMHAMVLHPNVQKRAQEEIDRVCGNRSPTFEDDLPYVR